MLHGLTGGSDDAYVRQLVRALIRNGFQAVVFNARGCGRTRTRTVKGMFILLRHCSLLCGARSFLPCLFISITCSFCLLVSNGAALRLQCRGYRRLAHDRCVCSSRYQSGEVWQYQANARRSRALLQIFVVDSFLHVDEGGTGSRFCILSSSLHAW